MESWLRWESRMVNNGSKQSLCGTRPPRMERSFAGRLTGALWNGAHVKVMPWQPARATAIATVTCPVTFPQRDDGFRMLKGTISYTREIILGRFIWNINCPPPLKARSGIRFEVYHHRAISGLFHFNGNLFTFDTIVVHSAAPGSLTFAKRMLNMTVM